MGNNTVCKIIGMGTFVQVSGNDEFFAFEMYAPNGAAKHNSSSPRISNNLEIMSLIDLSSCSPPQQD